MLRLSIIENLNEEQLLPVLQTEGALLITAGAGSGKTRLLTHRIAYLINEKKVSPYNILAITFTNKAANEMKQRVDSMIGSNSGVWISTFHSLCLRILRRDIDKLGFSKSFSVYADDEKNHILKELFASFKVEDESDRKTIIFHINRAKNNNLSPMEYQAEVVGESLEEEINGVYAGYQEKLKNSNALDFDDLLMKTFELFQKFPDVLAFYQDKFQYIHIDEFQDTNKVQYDIARMLAKKWQNILVVGDEDQCIYGWRGANIENIANFQKDFPNLKVFKLQQNYRSTKKIIDIANKVIEKNETRIKKVLWTENPEGDDVTYFLANSDYQEAEFVGRKIVDLIRNQGYSANDIAVLMRLNALSRNFEKFLNNAGIAYKVLGGFKFFERAEIKNVIAYLRILTNPFDEESLLRIFSFSKIGIGENTILTLRMQDNKPLLYIMANIDKYDVKPSIKKKAESFMQIYNILKEQTNLPVAEFVRFIIDTVDFKKIYNTDSEEDLTRLLNIEQFAESVKEFQKDNPEATLDEYLQSVALQNDLDNTDFEENSVLLSTVHAVKGLEFKIVFIVGMEEGVFPIIRNFDNDDIEEERRLMYVAITRAKQKLFLSGCRFRNLWGREQFQKPSRFLEEAELESFVNKTKPTFTPNAFSQPAGSKNFDDFKKGVQVFHSSFGVGEIVDDSEVQTSKMVTVNFNVLGAKKLSLEYAPLKILKK